jgi:hypothetical protein
MRIMLIPSILLFTAFTSPVSAQSRGVPSGRGPVTFAIAVADSSGAPVRDVKMRLSGAAARTRRLRSGRAVLEGLRAGAYLFRFEKAGYVTFEREVIARGGKPIDVKVRLTPWVQPPRAVGSQLTDAKFAEIGLEKQPHIIVSR